jgi:hypothetical protein
MHIMLLSRLLQIIAVISYLCGMRYIKLSETGIADLEKTYHCHARYCVRQRAQCLLLSNQGYSVPAPAKIFSTGTHTVRARFTRREENGISGLEILPGRGLKPAIKEDHPEPVSSIMEEVSVDPRNLSSVIDTLTAR